MKGRRRPSSSSPSMRRWTPRTSSRPSTRRSRSAATSSTPASFTQLETFRVGCIGHFGEAGIPGAVAAVADAPRPWASSRSASPKWFDRPASRPLRASGKAQNSRIQSAPAAASRAQERVQRTWWRHPTMRIPTAEDDWCCRRSACARRAAPAPSWTMVKAAARLMPRCSPTTSARTC